MRIAWFDAFSGISGDMTLGALVAAGWPEASLRTVPGRLKLDGVSIEVRAVRKGAFAATKVDVIAEGRQPHRHLHHIAAMLDAADLPEPVRLRAHAVFLRLAEAEAAVHGTTLEKVHFHEVGAADALVDVVGALLGLHELGVERVFASPLPLGGGFVETEHGRIPVPAPATALLLKSAPVRSTPIQAELVTPTGAALLATLVQEWGPPPEFRMGPIGLGAGSRDLAEQPNVLRIVLGEMDEAAAWGAGRIKVLETALDDESPQVLGELIPRLLEAGALDAMIAPVTMKKGRPGHWLVVLAPIDRAEALASLIFANTSTLGIRVREEQRWELARGLAEVDTPVGSVRMKWARLPNGDERAVPEFESVRELASRSGLPAREVGEIARAQWRLRASSKSTSPSKKTD